MKRTHPTVRIALLALATVHCASTTSTTQPTTESHPSSAADTNETDGALATEPPSASPSSAPAATHPAPIEPTLPVVTVDEIRARIEPAQHPGSALSLPQVCTRGTCRIASGGPAIALGLARGDGALVPPARAWFQIVEPSATVEIARDRSVDLLGVVLAGRVTARAVERRNARPSSGGAWEAFLLAEAGVVIRSADDHPVALVLISARDASSSPPPPSAPPRRTSDVRFRAIGDQPLLTWAGGAAHDRIVFEAPESPRASLGVLTMSPQLGVPEHRHENSWEVLTMIAADGTLNIEPHDTERSGLAYRFTGGGIGYVPAGAPHSWLPGDQPDETGAARPATQPLVGIQVYAGPGPEQRFRALAASAASR